MDQVLHVFTCIDSFKNVFERTRNDSSLGGRIVDTLHAKRFATARLSVREYSAIVTFQNSLKKLKKIRTLGKLAQNVCLTHRGVLIKSCLAGAKNFTNYLFCHVQFSGVIQNTENCCAIRAKF